MKTGLLTNCRILLSVAAMLAVIASLAACGSADEPIAEEAPAAEPATAPASTPASPSSSVDTPEPEPQGDVAPMFTLPAAAGESVSLGSFAGDRNVVLVFYRGFW